MRSKAEKNIRLGGRGIFFFFFFIKLSNIDLIVSSKENLIFFAESRFVESQNFIVIIYNHSKFSGETYVMWDESIALFSEPRQANA